MSLPAMHPNWNEMRREKTRLENNRDSVEVSHHSSSREGVVGVILSHHSRIKDPEIHRGVKARRKEQSTARQLAGRGPHEEEQLPVTTCKQGIRSQRN